MKAVPSHPLGYANSLTPKPSRRFNANAVASFAFGVIVNPFMLKPAIGRAHQYDAPLIYMCGLLAMHAVWANVHAIKKIHRHNLFCGKSLNWIGLVLSGFWCLAWFAVICDYGRAVD